jgi:hypothetical protein
MLSPPMYGTVVRPSVLPYTEASVCIVSRVDFRILVCARPYRNCEYLTTVPYVGDDSRLWWLLLLNALIGNGPVMPEICVNCVQLIIITLNFVFCLSNFVTFSRLYVG